MVVSLLIIPPMIARLFSRTPFQMIVSACIISIICNLIGIIISSQFDIPTAPSIVMVSSTFYLITSFIIQFRKYTRYK
jgi:zinc transport system permease protein